MNLNICFLGLYICYMSNSKIRNKYIIETETKIGGSKDKNESDMSNSKIKNKYIIETETKIGGSKDKNESDTNKNWGRDYAEWPPYFEAFLKALKEKSKENLKTDSAPEPTASTTKDPGCGSKNIDCQIGNGTKYTGPVYKTRGGLECQVWSVSSPHKHGFKYLGYHNECRNPDGEPGVWCYTRWPGRRWDYCDVKQCSTCHADFVEPLLPDDDANTDKMDRLNTNGWFGQCVLDDPTLLNQRNLFPKLLKDLLLVTPKLCTYACREKGYSYAGVKKEYQCWCGNSTPPSKTLKPDKECNRRCRIDERMFCGANKRMNIYSTEDPFEDKSNNTRVAFYRDGEFDIRQDYLIHQLERVGRKFKITFEFYIYNVFMYNDIFNILHFSQNQNSSHGDWVPGVWMNKGRFAFAFPFRGNTKMITKMNKGSWNGKSFPLDKGKWYTVEISQKWESNHAEHVEVWINGENLWRSKYGNFPVNFEDVAMYVGDKWSNPLKGKIRRLKVETIPCIPRLFRKKC